MKRSLLTLALLAALPTFAQDFDLTDMTPARPGENVESADVVTKGNVVVGKDEKTADQQQWEACRKQHALQS